MKKTGLFVSMLFAATSLFAGEVLTGDVAKAKFPAALQAMGLHDAKYMRLMDGVEYFYGRYDNLAKNSHDPNGFKNDMHLIRVDYANAPVRMKFWDSTTPTKTKRTTSAAASKCKALFGINGTFTNSSNTPQGFTKFQGAVIPNSNGCNSGLAMNDDKTFQYAQGWNETNAAGWSDVITSEAYGLHNGNIVYEGHWFSFANYPFSGVTADGILWIGVVDGRRSPISVGVSYWEIAEIQKALGCKEGMCHDGGGSTTMVISKELMTASDICDTQKASTSDNSYYTMNYLSDGSERAVINQLLFVENVALITPEIGAHGQLSINSTAVTKAHKAGLGETVNYAVAADSGYVIAALYVDGAKVDEATGRESYAEEFVANGDKTIAASFVKKAAWWLNPTVKNDFLLEAKSGNNGSDLTTQHPDVCLDEQEQDVFFSTSVHGYSSGSYLTGLREFSVTSLKGWNTGDAIKPVMGTDKNVNGTGTYAYSIAASRTAGAVVAMQKVNSGTKYPVICPIGGQWGGGTAFNSTRDDRYVMSVLSFPDDTKNYHTTSPGVFGTDGKHFYGGYSRNSHIHEFDVKMGTDGHLEFHHTGKVIKHKANVTAVICKKVTLGGQAKDVLFTSHHSSSLDSLDIVIPGEMAVQTNSSSLPTCLTIPYHLDNIAVTGIADGTPRIIGHVLDTANPQHGNYVVYDLKDDLSGLRFPDPIAIVNAKSAFGKATGCVASLDDDTTAFINYYNAKELHAITVQAYVPPPPEGSPDNPWQIGGATESDSITVQTNGTGGLVIGGEGASADGMMALPTGFDRNAIKHVTVGDGVTKLGSRFLKDFRRMTTLTCGSGVASFGEKALYRCLSLEEIEIGNANFDLSSLANAIVYQMAIKADGTLYMVPKVTVAGCTEMLYGKETLTDADWTQIGPLEDQNLEELKKAGKYHFFQTRLVK